MGLELEIEVEAVRRTKISQPQISFTNPLPMQYLGGKGRIGEWIVEIIKKDFPKSTDVADVFSGTGTISVISQNFGFTPHVNDIQPYSYCLLKGLFTKNRNGVLELSEYLLSNSFNKNLLTSGRMKMAPMLKKEHAFFSEGINRRTWIDYKRFVENTKIISNNKQIPLLRVKGNWNLICSYYSNTYFGVEQCLQLDLLRETAETLEENLKFQLMAATISVMTQCVSSTTHLAQYLKVSSQRTAAALVKKRKIDIVKEVAKRLRALSEFTVLKGATVTNLDFADAIKALPNTRQCIVYADPPYFKEHYSRYYHLLDTFYVYDYPKLTFNKRLDSITIGRYRENRIISEFGLKAKVKDAFFKLFNEASVKNFPVVLSYASTSLLHKEELLSIAKKHGYNVKLHSKLLMHSGQGQRRHKFVKEYLFVCKP